MLLRGEDLHEAEEWQARAATGKEPKTTLLQSEYVLASRKAAIRQQRITLGAVTFALVVAVALAVIALYQRNDAVNKEKIATSRELSVSAISQLPLDPELSVLLALEAESASKTQQAEDALRNILLGPHLLVAMRGHTASINSAVFSPDGRLVVTASEDGVARVWDIATERILAELHGHVLSMTSASFSSDSRLVVTSSYDGTARVWEAVSGKSIAVYRVQDSAVTSAAFSPDNHTVLTASTDGIARLWKVTGADSLVVLTGFGSAPAVKFSRDQSLLMTVDFDKYYWMRVWETGTGKSILGRLGWSFRGPAVVDAFSSAGQLLDVVDDAKTVQVKNVRTGEFIDLRGHLGQVYKAAFSSDDRHIITASGDGTARVWDATTGKCIAELSVSGDKEPVTDASLSLDSKFAVTISDEHAARVWEVATGKLIAELGSSKSGVTKAIISPDDNLVVTIDDGKVWKRATGKNFFDLYGRTGSVLSVKFSPDGKLIATKSELNPSRKIAPSEYIDYEWDVWDTATGMRITEMSGHRDLVTFVDFSPDGEFVVTSSVDKTARVWKPTTGTLISEFRGHTDTVNSAAFSSDGRLVVTASYDGTARVWDVATGRNIAELRGHTRSVDSATFSPDSRLIVTSSRDSTARIYPWEMFAPLESLIILAHGGVTRDLKCEERRLYLHDNVVCPLATPTPISLNSF